MVERPPTDEQATAKAELVDILSIESCRKALADAKAGKREPLRVVVIPKYAPAGTQGWVYELVKVNKTTVNLAPLGGGRGLNIDPFCLAEADDGDVAAYEKLREAAPAEIHTGTVVRLEGPGWQQHPDALWVVTGLKGMTEMSVARLGGEDSGQHWPKLPRTLVAAIIGPNGLLHALSLDPRFADEVPS